MDAELFFDEKEKLRTRVHFKEGYNIKYVGQHSVRTDACKKTVIKSQSILMAELTTRTPENENLSLSILYPQIDKGMREAKLLKKNEKLPKLGHVLDAREKEMKLAAKKRRKRIDKRVIYIPEKYAGNWRKKPLFVHGNRLAKQHKLPFRFRPCYGRHLN